MTIVLTVMMMIMMMMMMIKLSKAEKQSGVTRIKWAEGLILQLPKNHDGRNSWLLNFGISKEAEMLRNKRGIKLNFKTQSAIYKKNYDCI